jgi:hypothetical protein
VQADYFDISKPKPNLWALIAHAKEVKSEAEEADKESRRFLRDVFVDVYYDSKL